MREHTLLITHCVVPLFSLSRGQKGGREVVRVPLLENSEAGIRIQLPSVVNSPAAATGRFYLLTSNCPVSLGKRLPPILLRAVHRLQNKEVEGRPVQGGTLHCKQNSI